MASFSIQVCVVSIATAVFVGCGAAKSTDPRQAVEPSLDYATFVRESAQRMKKAEAGPKVAVAMFLENLDGYQKKPLGKNKDTYDAIFKSAQNLKQMKDRNASDAELRKGIEELVKLTEKLPSAPDAAK